MILKAEEIEKNLEHAIGTTRYIRFSKTLPKFLLTDGTSHLIESCNCYWLLKSIGIFQKDDRVLKHPKLQSLQLWTFERVENHGFLSCRWDRGEIVLRQRVIFTDFPRKRILIFVSPVNLKDGRYHIAYLRSEY